METANINTQTDTFLLPLVLRKICIFYKMLFKIFTCKNLILAASAEVLLQLLLLVAFK
jgi:hypothetical protein